jgi:CzcA family heavy metal efflux pump
MLNAIIKFCLSNRFLVLFVSLGLLFFGATSLSKLPIDVLPDLNRPRVTVFAEADGWAPEEVESLVTFPIERVLNGAPGVIAIRSQSAVGLSIINIEFDWGTDLYRNRQIVNEKLASVNVPKNVKTSLGPTTSLLGEIVWAGLTSPDGSVNPMRLRSLADWTIKQRLLTIPGVSNVLVMGGDSKQYQVLLKPEKLAAFGISIDEVAAAMNGTSNNRVGGFMLEGNKESPIRILARTTLVEELKKTVIKSVPVSGPSGMNVPSGGKTRIVTLADVADVVFAPDPNKRGDATIAGKPGVILRIIKQNDANTLAITAAIDEALKELSPNLPKWVKLSGDIFRQEWFISGGLSNVEEALRDSAIVVAIIITLFLANVRTTAITLISIPFSLLVAFIVFNALGLGINVMTLGGLTMAIGELVDDAIVDIENVFRRLRENALLPKESQLSSLKVVFESSKEVRNSIVYATILVALVFIPLLLLPGVDGKLLAPIGTAYIVALLASLAVSLTLVPVLASYFLPKYIEERAKKYKDSEKKLAPGYEADDTWFIRKVKDLAIGPIKFSMRHPKAILTVALASIVLTIGLYITSGKEGLPSFNEPTFTTMMFVPNGSSIEYTKAVVNEVALKVEKIPGVKHFAATMGRSEADAHASGVSEFEILIDTEKAKKEDIERDILKIYKEYEGKVIFSLGQPITHRMQELISGVRAPIVLRLYGKDLDTLRLNATNILGAMQKVHGIVNAQVEQEERVPQISLDVDRNMATTYGINISMTNEALETGLMGMSAAEVLDGNERYPLIVKFDPDWKGDLRSLGNLLISTASDKPITLSQYAAIRRTDGQNRISHDGAQRRILITGFIKDRDVVSAVEELKTKVSTIGIPPGYFVSYEGDYQAQQEATKRLSLIAVFVILSVVMVLFWHFRSLMLVGQVLISVVVAFLGGMLAVFITGNVLSTAHFVGFIALIGIVSRNGIMLVSHYLHLMHIDKMEWSEELVIRGSLERVAPVMMTALTASLALLPLIVSGPTMGKELLFPLATVIFGGLMFSTAIELFLRPGLFYAFGKVGAEKAMMKRGVELE